MERDELTIDEFFRRIHTQLAGHALSKGYNRSGPDGDNELYAFVQNTVSGDGHPIGEVIYKMRRYASLRHPADLEKAAAWCFLIWKHRQGE